MPSARAAAGRPSLSDDSGPAAEPYRHFLFDLDGTLVDSSHDLIVATNAMLAGLGLRRLDRSTVLAHVGQGVRRLVACSLETAAPGMGARLLEPGLAGFAAAYSACLLDRTRPFPGVEDALAGLSRRGVALSVLTNKPRRFTESILAGLGIDHCFFAAVCGDDDVPRKPDPGGALRLVAASGRPAAAAVLVGDSVEDVLTARAAGIASCAVRWGFRSAAELRAAGADHLVESPAALLLLAP
jgi:phosphoglycolate phosphatase